MHLNFCTTVILNTVLLFAQSVQFTDLAEEQGLIFDHDHGGSGEKFYVETMGSGVCLLDYDNDHDLDIYFCQGAPLPGWKKNIILENKLFRNDQGKWIDVTKSAGVGDWSYSIGCACGDIDNDGDTDLYVTNFGNDVFYRNNGNGTFTDNTKVAGIGNPNWASSAAFTDVDNDGWLDLYVCNYVEFSTDKNPWCGEQLSGRRAYCDPDVFKGVADILYHNNGNGTFSDWSEKAGLNRDHGKGLGVVAVDIENDGDMDYYIANDKVMNLLYVNNGQGLFTEDALFRGVGFNENGKAEAGMGVDAGDIDQDGTIDLFVTNFSGESNTLYINDGDGYFMDKTFAAGLGQPSIQFLGFGTKFVDLDLDGWLDIFVVNGHVIDNISYFNKDYSHAQRKQIFLNNKNGSFREITSENIGDAANPTVGRGAAFGDIDNDGDWDVVISNNNGRANLLVQNGTPIQNWINLLLVGKSCNRDAIGAKIKIKTANAEQIAYVNPGASYLASNDKRILFGLGKVKEIDQVEVNWPGGEKNIFAQIKANHFYKIEQGGSISFIK